MHYYQFNISDYKSHTEHLEPLEDLAYRRLLDWCYLHEKPLPKDINEIAKFIRMRSHCDCITTVLHEFFSVNSDGEFIHKRVFLEIEKADKKSSDARKAAAARWEKARAGADKLKDDAIAMQPHSERNATQDTIPITQDTLPKKKRASPFILPDNIDTDTWKAFIEHRQKLKAPMTDRAKTLLINKMGRMTGSANDILNQSIENGWKGVFELKEGNNNGSHQQNSKPSLAERLEANRKRAEQQDNEQPMGKDGVYLRS